MPIVENNFSENILTLIQDGSYSSGTFNQNDIAGGNHYIRMSVFEEGKFIAHYYSNKTWNNDEVYYVDDVPYYRYDALLGYAVDTQIAQGEQVAQQRELMSDRQFCTLLSWPIPLVFPR